jgi:hypothetical protein
VAGGALPEYCPGPTGTALAWKSLWQPSASATVFASMIVFDVSNTWGA